jgi:hypothetical protein
VLKERKLKAIKRTLGEPWLLKGDEAVFVCPQANCRKDRAKLSVNLARDTFHCWICDYGQGKGSLLVLMAPHSEEREEYRRELEDRRGAKKTEPPAKVYDPVALPDEFKTLTVPSKSPYYRAAMEYLAGRGVHSDDILRYKLGYCDGGDYKNRILIPSFDLDGELNFFTARAIYKGVRSYDHGNFDKDIIFNELLVDWSRPVTLTEGPFDAIKIGDNAIPLQTSSLSEYSKLFRKIVTEGIDVFFALDSDALKKQLKIISAFLHYGTECYHVHLNGFKDAGDMTKEQFAAAKAKAFPVKGELDVLRLRVCA